MNIFQRIALGAVAVSIAVGGALGAAAPANAAPNDPWHNSSCDSLTPFYNPAVCQQAQLEWQRVQSQYGPGGNFGNGPNAGMGPDNFDPAASSHSSYGIGPGI